MRSRAVLLGSIVVSFASCQARIAPPPQIEPPHQKSLGIEAYPEAQDLYAFTETQRAKYGWPALGVGVIFRGKIVGLGMAGERRLGSGEWATLDDRFEVGSCAKSITAMVAATLVEEGKLRWEDRIIDILPTVQAGALPEYADVTLEQLLGHRSGLEQWMKSNNLWSAWHRKHADVDLNGEATGVRRGGSAVPAQVPARPATLRAPFTGLLLLGPRFIAGYAIVLTNGSDQPHSWGLSVLFAGFSPSAHLLRATSKRVIERRSLPPH